ncbi:MAG: TetR/AcrR family transcriptional regulator [Nakamurella sp.]
MRKGELTRTMILDDALQTVSQVGFGGLSIGKLAEQTEMSKSGLFAHFKSMDQLQLQVLQRARERFLDAVVRPALTVPRGESRVRAVFNGWLRWSEVELVGGCVFVAAAVELDDRPGELRDALVRAELDWLELLATVAGTAISEGDFRLDLDTEQFAFEVHSVMLGHHHASRLLRDKRALDRTKRSFESIVDAARPAR